MLYYSAQPFYYCISVDYFIDYCTILASLQLHWLLINLSINPSPHSPTRLNEMMTDWRRVSSFLGAEGLRPFHAKEDYIKQKPVKYINKGCVVTVGGWSTFSEKLCM